MDMGWEDIYTKPFRRYCASNNTYGHALVDLNEKPFQRLSCKKRYFLTRNSGILSQNRLADFLLIITPMDNNWWDFDTKQFRRFSANNNTMDRHWWDLSTKTFR